MSLYEVVHRRRDTRAEFTGEEIAPDVLRRVLIGFATDRSYVTATTKADGSFSAQVQPARHVIELGGLPPGYSLASVKLGSQDLTRGVPVEGSDVSGLVISLAIQGR